LRLSNLRIERQEEKVNNPEESAQALLHRAFRRLFEEHQGALYEKVEDSLLRAAYQFCHHNQVHTASLLGLSRNVTRARLIAIGELVVNKRRVVDDVPDNRVLQLSI
jgi:DNA-binding protein Fis